MSNLPTTMTVNSQDRDPVAVTYTADSEENGVARFVNPDPNGVPIGNEVLQVSTRKTASGNYQSVLRISSPVLAADAATGAVKVDHTNYVKLTFDFSSKSTTSERKNLMEVVANLTGGTVSFIDDTLVNLKTPY